MKVSWNVMRNHRTYGYDTTDEETIVNGRVIYLPENVHGSDNLHLMIPFNEMDDETIVDGPATIVSEPPQFVHHLVEPTWALEATMVDHEMPFKMQVIEHKAEAKQAFMDACRAASDEANKMGAALFGGVAIGMGILAALFMTVGF